MSSRPTPNPLANGKSAQAFLQSYWQKRAAVIRGAIDPTTCAIERDQMLQMATSDAVESRLISHWRRRWQLQHGPFEAAEIPSIKRKKWTMLIQGANMTHHGAHQLLNQFRFVPDVRVDDLMVSIASDGGGVGPHTDSYDVFLVQIAGRRRWSISAPGPHRLVPDQPVKLLADFQATEVFELNPGDMLYLPAHWAHDGVAIGPCMTASIGFIAPKRDELRAAWLTDLADHPEQIEAAAASPRYRDLGNSSDWAQWRAHPAKLPALMHDRLTDWLLDWRANRRSAAIFVGRYLTEPKDDVWFDRPDPADLATTLSAICHNGVQLDQKSRAAWRARQFFINGEHLLLSADIAPLMRRLADHRALPATMVQKAMQAPDAAALITSWLEYGWLHASES